jgi:2-pyrone-4,6-dicarboxylate lactonase
MDKDWFAFNPNPSRPEFVAPYGSVDAHCHVFGPVEKFPFAPERKYTPCDFLGFSRNVIVQATCHGADNSALVDALRNSSGHARGIAVVDVGVTDNQIDLLHDAGVRGVRFNFVRRLVDPPSHKEFREIVARIEPLGWHIVVYFEARDLLELYDFLAAMPTTVVVDHMGRPNVTKPVYDKEFELFIKLMRENENIWSKVSCPERLSLSGPAGYDDVVPFARRVIDSFSDRVLWGSDWPHPNMRSHMPDDGKLVDFIPKIATTTELQEKLLVDNPMRLYWPEEVA